MKRRCFCDFWSHFNKKYENVRKYNDFDYILIKKLENTILFQFFWTHFNEKVWKHLVCSTFFQKMFENIMILIQKYNFQTLAPEVDKMNSRRLDLRHSGLGSRSRQNELQKVRFEHFQALAPEVDKMSSRRVDLSIFRPWLQKSTKWAPEGPICGIPALAPEVDKMSPRRLDLRHSGLGSTSRHNGSREL